MRTVILILLLSGLFALGTTAVTYSSSYGSYIIVLRDYGHHREARSAPTHGHHSSSNRATVNNLLRRYASISTSYAQRNYLPRVSSYSSFSLGFFAVLNARALVTVRRLPQVYFVEKEQTYHVSAPEWHLDRIDQRSLPLDREYCPKYTGQGVDIYIIDSGIRYSHSEFKEGRAKYGGFDFQPFSAPNGPGSDCMGHGTHVAALAGGTTVGAARNATLHSIRIFGCHGGTSTSTILKAIEHVVQRKSGFRSRTTIMSMSFGGPYSASINLCVRIAYSRGILPVAAAGNERQYARHRSPASSPYAITVGATDKNDNAASFTNYGWSVNIFAPGVNINSASHRSDNRYTHKSGTSMAAPLVSGAAAMILHENPSFTPSQVMAEIVSQSTKNVVKFGMLPSYASVLTPNRLLYIIRKPCVIIISPWIWDLTLPVPLGPRTLNTASPIRHPFLRHEDLTLG